MKASILLLFLSARDQYQQDNRHALAKLTPTESTGFFKGLSLNLGTTLLMSLVINDASGIKQYVSSWSQQCLDGCCGRWAGEQQYIWWHGGSCCVHLMMCLAVVGKQRLHFSAGLFIYNIDLSRGQKKWDGQKESIRSLCCCHSHPSPANCLSLSVRFFDFLARCPHYFQKAWKCITYCTDLGPTFLFIHYRKYAKMVAIFSILRYRR